VVVMEVVLVLMVLVVPRECMCSVCVCECVRVCACIRDLRVCMRVWWCPVCVVVTCVCDGESKWVCV
jgi:hypothetical protein